jgi:hypothetical protein
VTTTKKKEANRGEILVAASSFVCTHDGKSFTFHKGVTRIRAGHPVIKGREHLFLEMDASADYDVEAATSEPGEKR